MVKKIYVGVPNFTPVQLPSGYTQVEYIQSSGTQYVNTGVIPSGNIRVQLTYNATAEGFIIASETNWATNSYDVHTRLVVLGSEGTDWTNIFNQNITVDVKRNVYTDTAGRSNTFNTTTVNNGLALFLFCSNRGGTPTDFIHAQLIGDTKIYDDDVLVRFYVPCTNPSGEVGLYDLIGGQFYSNAGTGTFIAGPSASSVAQQVKKMYVGINGIARQIKKAYIGVGGIARPCFGGELAYYGTITPLSTARGSLVGTSIGDYALFGGGTGYSSVVDAYSTSLVRTIPTALSRGRKDLNATNNDSYGIFGTGIISGGTIPTNVDAYSASLTRTIANTFLNGARYYGATSANNYAIFGGGYLRGGRTTNQIQAYDSSLTTTNPSTLTVARFELSAASIGGYSIFAGGSPGSGAVSTVDAYNASFTRTTPASLNIGRSSFTATSVGNYALFGGGLVNTAGSSVGTTVVDAYDTSLVHTVITPLTEPSYYLMSTSLNNYGIFGGGVVGEHGEGVGITAVNVYDESLTQTTPQPYSSPKNRGIEVSVRNHPLFGGVYGTRGTTNIVEAYTVA